MILVVAFLHFAYLKNLEVNIIIIDDMFMKAIANKTNERAMFESINNIEHVMGLKAIAEFAENSAIIDKLKKWCGLRTGLLRGNDRNI